MHTVIRALFALILLLLPVVAVGQSASAVCNFPYKLSGAQSQSAQANASSGCSDWSFTYAGTAPATVEMSTDGVTWDQTGMTVTSGAFPTSSGRGVVKFSGYAPYMRVRSTGAVGQTVTGKLYGSLGITARGSTLPNWLPNWLYTYTPVVPADWTGPIFTNANDVRTDDSTNGKISLRHNALGGTVLAQFICQNHTITTGEVIRGTFMIAPSNWQNDGGAQLAGFVFRNSTTGDWAGGLLESRGTSTNAMNWGNCNDAANHACTVFTSYNGGFTQSFGGWGTSTPLTYQYTVNATTIDFAVYSAFGLSFPRGSPPGGTFGETVARATLTGSYDQVCFASYVPNPNYFQSLLILGFSVS